MVYLGNQEFVVGDIIFKLFGGSGGGQGLGKVSLDGEGMDEFVFQIIQEEFLDFLFDDFEFFNLVCKKLKDMEFFKYVCFGYIIEGVLVKFDVVCLFWGVYVCRFGLGGVCKKKICDLEEQFEVLKLVFEDLDLVFSYEDQIQVFEEEIV